MRLYTVKETTRRQLADLTDRAPGMRPPGPPAAAAGAGMPFQVWAPSGTTSLPYNTTTQVGTFDLSSPGLHMVAGSLWIRAARSTALNDALVNLGLTITAGAGNISGATQSLVFNQAATVGTYFYIVPVLFWVDVQTAPVTVRVDLTRSDVSTFCTTDLYGGDPFHALRITLGGLPVPVSGGSTGHLVMVSGATLAPTTEVMLNTSFSAGGGGASGGQFQIDVGTDLNVAFTTSLY